MAEIRVENVYKRFARPVLAPRRGPQERLPGEEAPEAGPIVALDGVSLTIADGEAVSIVGPSGCGKSTLLRIVAGLEQPDQGRVLYDGVDMVNVPPKDRGIGMVFQNYALYPHWDTYDNLGFFFRLRKREHEIDPKVREVAEVLGVSFQHLLSRKPPTLSGGQQQRVAIGRCIIRDPKLFLFDEPLSNLDAKLRSDTRVQIKRLINRFRITSLYVTHDQGEAVAMGDRIVVMRHGKIAQVGTFRDLYDRPADTFVASFFGSPAMNFLSGHIAEDMFVSGPVRIPLPARLRGRARSGQAVRLGVRPEHLGLAPDSEGVAEAAAVEVVEHLPSARAQFVYLSLLGQQVVARISQETLISRGDRALLRPEADWLYLFDGETGRNLAAE